MQVNCLTVTEGESLWPASANVANSDQMQKTQCTASLTILNNVQVDLLSIKLKEPAIGLQCDAFTKIADSIMSCSATLQHLVLSNFRFNELRPSLRHGLLVIIRDLSSAIQVLWRHLNAETHRPTAGSVRGHC